jgi:hypothetical protein
LLRAVAAMTVEAGGKTGPLRRDETPVFIGEIPNFLVLSHGVPAC